MISIPKQIQQYRFIKVKPKDKRPIENGWQTDKNYSYNDQELVKHLGSGGNYGLLCGTNNLAVIDADSPEVQNVIDAQLPKTFKVSTSKEGCCHNYYIIPELKKKIVLADSKKGHYGEVQYQGQFVVAPGSIHPSTKKYSVVDDSKIATISKDQLLSALKPFLKKEKIKPIVIESQNKDEISERIKQKIKISELMQEKGYDISRHPTMCLLGHDSQNKSCFSWDDTKGLWNCYHCGAAGDVFSFIQKHDQVGFITAKKILIQKAGIEFDESAVLKLFDKEDIELQYLDLGFVDGHFYYGTNVKGREAIILDDGRVLRNTLEKVKRDKEVTWIGENEIKKLFNYSGYIGDISPRWSKSSCKEFLQGKSVNKLDVAKRIKKQIDFFMDFGEIPETSYVQTCVVLATYCYPLFYWFPHFLFNAPAGSGKSKNAYLLMKMSFGGYDLGASAGVTPAQMFRTLEANRGTILIDEFERRDKSESQLLVNQILNASCSKDAYVIRTEQIDRKWKAWKFPISCPKYVCNITGINSTSLSRFVVFHLLKTLTKKGKNKPYKQKYQKTFQEIRDDCHILILQHWREISLIYDILDLELSNRDEDNWLPLAAIAKWLGRDFYDPMMRFIKSYKELQVDTGDLTETLFIRLSDYVSEEGGFYTAKELAALMEDELKMYKSPSTWVGRTLKRYKFTSIHRGKGNGYILKQKQVNNILTRYFPNYTNKDSQSSDSSLPSNNSQDSRKSEGCEQGEVIPEVGITEKQPKIHHKCHICGNSPVSGFDDDAQQKPLCSDCLSEKHQKKSRSSKT